MPKFKIGDVVVRNNKNPHCRYDFGRNGKICVKGDVVKISAVGNRNYEILYSVEGAYIKEPNWSGVEENFDLFKIKSWKEVIQNETNA